MRPVPGTEGVCESLGDDVHNNGTGCNRIQVDSIIETPVGNANHFISRLFQYISLALH